MNFIEVTDGICIRKDNICCVERTKDGKARIITDSDSYTTNFPYETMLKMLENFNGSTLSKSREFNGGQHWVG